MIRPVAIAILTTAPAPAPSQEAAWSGPYAGLSVGVEGEGAGLFLGAMAERGSTVLGFEVGAGAEEGDLALTGRLGLGLGGTLFYGLAGLSGLGQDEVGDGEAALVLGAGASRRLGGFRVGGELRHDLGEHGAQGGTRLGGRVALEF